jgi:hypothetical protein
MVSFIQMHKKPASFIIVGFFCIAADRTMWCAGKAVPAD